MNWPSTNSINFGDTSLWPQGATIKTLRGPQREIDGTLNPNERRFVCKLFSNLSKEQSKEGVQTCIENLYKAKREENMNEDEVDVHVKEFSRKDPRNTGKKAFTLLVVPKDKNKRIKDFMEEKWPPSTEYSDNKIICRAWGGTIPEDLGQYIGDKRTDTGSNVMS